MNITRGPIPGNEAMPSGIVRGPIPGGKVMMSNIIKSPSRAPLPEHLETPMRLFRLDLAGLPTDFLAWHEELENAEARRLTEAHGLTIHACRTVSAGDLDGMRVIELVTETRSGKLLKLQWHPGNQGFMVSVGHGRVAIFAEDLA